MTWGGIKRGAPVDLSTKHAGGQFRGRTYRIDGSLVLVVIVFHFKLGCGPCSSGPLEAADPSAIPD